MGPVLFDTSVYVTALRVGSQALLRLRTQFPSASLWLSSVVLEELYAGVRPRDAHVVERLERDFDRAGRVLVPNLKDWASAGKVLARLAAKYGYESIGRARLTNDALLAMSAARNGITILTANTRDFARLSEFRPFHWLVQQPQVTPTLQKKSTCILQHIFASCASDQVGLPDFIERRCFQPPRKLCARGESHV